MSRLRRRPAPAASAASGDADLRGRIGGAGDRDLPGPAASAASAASGSGTRLIGGNEQRRTDRHAAVRSNAPLAPHWSGRRCRFGGWELGNGTGKRRERIVVVGAGVFGSWTAHHLQNAGHRVTLIDALGRLA